MTSEKAAFRKFKHITGTVPLGAREVAVAPPHFFKWGGGATATSLDVLKVFLSKKEYKNEQSEFY